MSLHVHVHVYNTLYTCTRRCVYLVCGYVNHFLPITSQDAIKAKEEKRKKEREDYYKEREQRDKERSRRSR